MKGVAWVGLVALGCFAANPAAAQEPGCVPAVLRSPEGRTTGGLMWAARF
jgi:hypothetical protein